MPIETKTSNHDNNPTRSKLKLEHLLNQTDVDFNTLLHLAGTKKSTQIAKILLDIIFDNEVHLNRIYKRYLDVNLLKKRNVRGETFFQVACNNGLSELVLYMLGHFHHLNESMYEPLHDFDHELNTCLMSCILNAQLKCFQILVTHGAQLNAINRRKQTALHLSCRAGFVEAVQTLLLYECEYLCMDDMRMNALDYACESGCVELVRLLMSQKDAHLLVSAQCLFSAIESKHPYVVEYLLKSKYWMLLLLRCEETLIISHLIEKMVKKLMEYLVTLKVLAKRFIPLNKAFYRVPTVM